MKKLKKISSRLCYSVSETAALTGLSTLTIYRKIEIGEWPVISINEKAKRAVKRIPAKFLYDFFNQGEPPQPEPEAVKG